MFECVVNISEGRRLDVLDDLSYAAGPSLRDRHADATHNRSVFTLIHERDELRRGVVSLIVSAMDRLDLRQHEGVHPRFGVVDVVPFVALEESRMDEARALRDEIAAWMSHSFDVPVFLYGELRDGSFRTLPDLRREAFRSLTPDMGPSVPHVQHGACALGARGVLVAWNLWVSGISLDEGRDIAKSIRQSGVRALAFQIGDLVQISCNLTDPTSIGPSYVYDQVLGLLAEGVINHAELVGLIPEDVVRAEEPKRWEQLGLSIEYTIEARLS